MKTITRQKQTVLVKRHLVDEGNLLACMKQLCDDFTELIESTSLDKIKAEVLSPLEKQLEEFTAKAQGVQTRRAEISDLINFNRAPENLVSVRQFIGECNEGDRSEMERMRAELVDQTNEIHAIMTGNGAVVYYSFDFFRQLLGGLSDRSAQESSYGSTGKTNGLQVGNLYGKAC